MEIAKAWACADSGLDNTIMLSVNRLCNYGLVLWIVLIPTRYSLVIVIIIDPEI